MAAAGVGSYGLAPDERRTELRATTAAARGRTECHGGAAARRHLPHDGPCWRSRRPPLCSISQWTEYTMSVVEQRCSFHDRRGRVLTGACCCRAGGQKITINTAGRHRIRTSAATGVYVYPLQ
jgi:hypothetical protein